MIRLQETENEFLLYIPATQRHRAKKIRPREWDRQRICWVYPRTHQTLESLLAEFGNDSTAKISIGKSRTLDEQKNDEGRDSEIQSLRFRLSQLQTRIRYLAEESRKSAADRERTASALAGNLQGSELENNELRKQNKQLETDIRTLTDNHENTAADWERRLGDMADNCQRKEQQIGKLTKQNARFKAGNEKLNKRIKELEIAESETMNLRRQGRLGGKVSRPNRAVLSDAIDIFRDSMRPFVIRWLKQVPGGRVEEVIRRSLPIRLADEFDRNLRRHCDLASAIDVNFFPMLVQKNWRDAFSLTFQGRDVVRNELWMIAEARNVVSHPPVVDFDPEYVGAYLYHIADVLGRINAPDQKERVIEIRADWNRAFG